MKRLWPLVMLLSCSPDAVSRDFDAYVATVNSCESASDCTLVFTDCPLGCFHAVRADKKTEVEAEAARRVSLYRAGGQSCAYDCVTPGEVSCANQRCAVGTQP